MTYLGHSFAVPRSWRVIDLGQHQRTCVRFDRHTVYLGVPSHNQACPSFVVGTTEAMLIEPAPRHARHVSIMDPVTRRITVVARRIRIMATFDAHRREIYHILASAGLRHPVPDPPKATAATVPPLPFAVTNGHGFAFDTCTAPSQAVMRTWWNDSPYSGVGIYIGGSDAACAQPNLTPSWLRHAAAEGWHFIPLYVGPQASFGELTTSSASQGTAAAQDAAVHAEELGFARGAPIYYDMEAYLPGQSSRVLQFLSAWTVTLHKLGYASGVYSSSASGISDLAHQYGRGTYTMPDVIYDALWDGIASTYDDTVFAPGEWPHHRRIHQYNGNVTQVYGGVSMDVDQDYMNVLLPAPPPPPPPPQPAWTSSPSQGVSQPDGSTDVFYRGTDGRLWYLRHVPGHGWLAPVALGGKVESEPSAVVLADGQIMVFYQGTGGRLWQVRSRPSGWSTPRALPQMGVLDGRPEAVAQPGGVYVFWKDSPGAHLSYARYRQGVGWHGPHRLGGRLASDPWPVVSAAGAIHVFWKGRTGRLWQVAGGQGSAWSRPENVGMGRLGSGPQATTGPDGKIEVFWRARGRTSMRTAVLTAQGHWRGPYAISAGQALSPPAVVSAAGTVYVFFRGKNSRLWQLTPAPSGRWAGPPHLLASQPGSPPFAVAWSGQLKVEVFWNARDGKLWRLSVSPGNHTAGPTEIGSPLP